ncbi:hypothetical protein HanIR_Chr04g0201021 [Helianthus annuus]|nr:hypothetical protein HanIR_Chr04g0201021 [Helianthus annuus]
MTSRTSGTSSSHSRSNRQGRRSSTAEDSLVNYVYALREAIDEMTGVEEAFVDRINHLTVGLEGYLREVNLLHQRLNILTSPPLVPIITQRAWNVVPEVIIPTEWYTIHPEPPQDIVQGVPVGVPPPLQDVEENEAAFFLPKEIE